MSMATDDERREVARRLICLAEDGSAYATVDAMHVLHTIGLYYADIDRLYFRGCDVKDLADLIDPDTTTDTTKSPELTTKCDRDALLELADEMDRRQHDVATAATDGVVDAWCLREYADLIREACGEAVRNG